MRASKAFHFSLIRQRVVRMILSAVVVATGALRNLGAGTIAVLTLSAGLGSGVTAAELALI